MFNEKTQEWSKKQNKDIPVWQTPKYQQARKKAIELIESKKYDLTEGDFWILMNETKTGKMQYTGLIISHNGCLKINDAIEEKLKFKPSCMTLDKEGYGNSLVFTYINDEQGIYEVGEVSKENCTNAYPYAMAVKRCMDRVILKNCKLAYDGVYSDSEAEEFKEPEQDIVTEKAPEREIISEQQAMTLESLLKSKYDDDTITKTLKDGYKVNNVRELDIKQYVDIVKKIGG